MASASTYPQLADAPALDLQVTDPTYQKMLRLASYVSYLLPFLSVFFPFLSVSFRSFPFLSVSLFGSTVQDQLMSLFIQKYEQVR